MTPRLIPALVLAMASCTAGDFETLAERATEGGRFAEAQGYYERLAGWYPERIEYQLWVGRLAAWQEHYDEANGWYARVLVAEPTNVEALVGRADIATWREDYDAADTLLRRARRIVPDDPQVRLAFARRYRLDGNPARAARIVEHILIRDPNNCEATQIHDIVTTEPDGSLLARIGRRMRRTLCDLD